MTAPTAERIAQIREACARPRFRAGVYDVRDLIASLDYVADRVRYMSTAAYPSEVAEEILVYLGWEEVPE